MPSGWASENLKHVVARVAVHHPVGVRRGPERECAGKTHQLDGSTRGTDGSWGPFLLSALGEMADCDHFAR